MKLIPKYLLNDKRTTEKSLLAFTSSSLVYTNIKEAKILLETIKTMDRFIFQPIDLINSLRFSLPRNDELVIPFKLLKISRVE